MKINTKTTSQGKETTENQLDNAVGICSCNFILVFKLETTSGAGNLRLGEFDFDYNN